MAKLKHGWFSHEIHPLVGTSLLLEVELSENESETDNLYDVKSE